MGYFKDYGIEIPFRRTSGQIKCKCPQCNAKRNNKHDRSLSVNLDEGVWNCHYCGWSGRLESFNKPEYKPRKTFTKPKEQPQSGYSDKILSYLCSRGISEATAKKCKVGEGIEPMPPAPKSDKKEWRKINTLQFRYYLDGELINIKYRTGDKVFKLVKGAELIPYNLDSIKDEPTCIITEGEFDCLSFVEAGFKACVSVPNGANANLECFDDFIEGWFDDKETIYIASDTDSKGIELRKELIRRFGAERCKVVTYAECKDANEHLTKYGVQSLRECVNQAKDVPIEGIFTVRDFKEAFYARYEKGLVGGLKLGLDNLDELITWESGRLCVVTGYPSHGKTSAIIDFCLRFGMIHGWKSVFFSPESGALEDFAAVMSQWIVGKRFFISHMSRTEVDEVYEYLADNISMICPPSGNKLDYILERAAIEVMRKGVKIVVIDPFNTIECEQGKQSETLYINGVLDKMIAFARKYDVLFILAAHPSKPSAGYTIKDIPTLSQISGSQHFWNRADYGIVIHRIKNDDNENQGYTIYDIQKVKDLRLGKGGRCMFKFNVINRRFVPYDPDNPSMFTRYSWDSRNYLHHNILDSVQPIIEQASQEERLLNAINEFERGINSEVPF